jgi:hypothetical protein
MTDKSIAAATIAVFEIVRTLGGPRDAAKALAGAHVLLLESEGITDETSARARLDDSLKGILGAWRGRAGLPVQQ